MGRCCIFSSIIPGGCSIIFPVVLPYFGFQIDGILSTNNCFKEALHRIGYNGIYASKLHTKMYQNTFVDFKLGYVDAKSYEIAICVETYPSGSFIQNRTNMHEMQNQMKIAFCVKPPLLSILLADKGGST